MRNKKAKAIRRIAKKEIKSSSPTSSLETVYKPVQKMLVRPSTQVFQENALPPVTACFPIRMNFCYRKLTKTMKRLMR